MIAYIAPIVNLFICGTIVYYLFHLEKIDCKCSLTFQRNYIYYYTIILFIINLVNLFFHDKLKELSLLLLPLNLILLIAGIINVVYIIEYVEDMKKQNCKCSDSMFRDLMFIVAILQIFAWLLIVLTTMYIIAFKMKINKNTNTFSLK